MKKINFYNADVKFVLPKKKQIRHLIKKIFLQEDLAFDSVNFIFCSDEYLLKVNHQFLKHDFYTDIITFPLTGHNNQICGEIYVSIERVKENAKIYKTLYQNELLRVIIHGILHLCGYNDKDSYEKKQMRKKEDHFLQIYNDVSREI